MKININIFLSPKIIISLIIIYPLLFIWQGLDFSDTGYFLSCYQQVFNDPESISGKMLSWLTNIIGGVWVLLFGDSLGLLGVNLAGVIVTYVTIWLSYLILKPYIEKRILLIGLLLTVIFAKWFYLLSYYNLTPLFLIASAFFMINGLRNNKIWQIAISGLIVGFSILIRYPNILGLFLILSIILFGVLNKTKIKIQVIQLVSFIFGYIVSVLLTLFAIKIIGIYDFVISSFKEIFFALSDVSGQHGANSLMKIFYMECLKVVTFATIAITFILLMPKVLNKFKNRYVYYGFIIIPIILATIFYALVLWNGFHINHFIVFLVISVLYAILLLYIVNIEKSSNEFRVVTFITLLVLTITPIGSSSGLFTAINAMWLAFPIAFAYIVSLKELKIELKTIKNTNSSHFSFSLDGKETLLIKKIVIILIVIFSLLSSFIYTLRDVPNRFEMRYSVNNQRLKGIFTNKERARVVQELLDEMSNYVKEDDYLLAYEAISTLYFLTKTRPYLYDSQPLFYRPFELRKYLDKAIKERPYLPVIVRAKGSVWDPKWPVESRMIRPDERNTGNRGILEEFIKTSGYSLVWENDFFEILLPAKNEK